MAPGPMQGREVAIVEAARLPVGRGHTEKGYYRDVHPSTLLAATYSALIERTGIDAAEVEDVAAGCCEQWGEQGMNIGRNAWLEAGLPITVPAATIDRQCGSSQQAINYAAALIAAGVHDVAIGAGVEHMGRNSIAKAEEVMDRYGRPFSPALLERHGLVHQGISAEMIAAKWGLSRRELDELAAESHARAARATSEGRFDREIIPFTVGETTLTADQGIRPDTTVERLSALQPAFLQDGTGKLTAGNSSQISDGAAGVMLVERQKAVSLGLPIRAVIVDQFTVGVDPVMMLTGPIPVTRKILERNQITMSDIDLFEINEAFASVVGAWQRELDADMAKVNVNGGAIALGHAMGATGARLLTTLLHELERTDKECGLVAMCVGGGIGTATLIRRV